MARAASPSEGEPLIFAEFRKNVLLICVRSDLPPFVVDVYEDSHDKSGHQWRHIMIGTVFPVSPCASISSRTTAPPESEGSYVRHNAEINHDRRHDRVLHLRISQTGSR